MNDTPGSSGIFSRQTGYSPSLVTKRLKFRASALTHARNVIACAHMKIKFLAVIAGLAIVAAGCVGTVNGKRTGAVPFVNDRVEGRYERAPAQVYGAAKAVLSFNGTILNESTIHGTNTVLAVEGKVNQRSVWIAVQPLDAKITSVVIQARTSGGGTDLQLCHELDKQIALKLVR